MKTETIIALWGVSLTFLIFVVAGLLIKNYNQSEYISYLEKTLEYEKVAGEYFFDGANSSGLLDICYPSYNKVDVEVIKKMSVPGVYFKEDCMEM